MDPAYANETVWINTEDGCVEVEPPADPENPGESVIKTAYQDRWEVITAAFTEKACEEYLERNRHRLSRYRDLDIYADSLCRCPEMIAIREFLMNLPLPQAGEEQS